MLWKVLKKYAKKIYPVKVLIKDSYSLFIERRKKMRNALRLPAVLASGITGLWIPQWFPRFGSYLDLLSNAVFADYGSCPDSNETASTEDTDISGSHPLTILFSILLFSSLSAYLVKQFFRGYNKHKYGKTNIENVKLTEEQIARLAEEDNNLGITPAKAEETFKLLVQDLEAQKDAEDKGGTKKAKHRLREFRKGRPFAAYLFELVQRLQKSAYGALEDEVQAFHRPSAADLEPGEGDMEESALLSLSQGVHEFLASFDEGVAKKRFQRERKGSIQHSANTARVMKKLAAATFEIEMSLGPLAEVEESESSLMPKFHDEDSIESTPYRVLERTGSPAMREEEKKRSSPASKKNGSPESRSRRQVHSGLVGFYNDLVKSSPMPLNRRLTPMSPRPIPAPKISHTLSMP